ncbi:MAG TPA: TM2 domain-containing protein [Gemmatimonadales bacterium]|nr:TM2 domain-containing protein [Gemmatimonadales bacterium]
MTLPDAYDDDAVLSTPEPQVSKRSRGVALGLSIIGGFFGLHRFYVEKPTSAIAMICTLGGLGMWWLYDVVLLAAGEFRDSHDLPLRNWGVEETPGALRELSSRAEQRVNEMEEQLDALRQQFGDLAERVDFAERMLAQQRSRPSLPAPDS